MPQSGKIGMNMRGLLVVLILNCAWAQKAACLIQPGSVGPIHDGMTVMQVRQVLRGATLKPSEDADRLPTMIIIRGGLHTMDLYTDNERSKVGLIRVFDESCATGDGVHPGMSLTEVGAKFGRLRRLRVIDAEAREFADFDRLPDWLEVQVGNGRTGNYPPGKRCTTSYAPGARIGSLWVSHAGVKRVPYDEFNCDVPRRR